MNIIFRNPQSYEDPRLTPLLSDPISTPAPRSSPSSERDSPIESSVLGACQWFHYEDDATLDRAVELLRELGVHHLRTGISWADYHRPGGRDWYDHQFDQLREFELLVSIWHTPPSLSENGRCSGPPRRLKDYADFVWLTLQRWGDRIGHVELWNEPANRLKWDFENCDPRWDKFGRMIGMAARTAQMCDVPTVLGGMTPVDPQWLGLLRDAGALEDVDVIAVHGFPGMWWWGDICWEWERDWDGWEEKLSMIRAHSEGRPVWVTETGLATWDLEAGRCAFEAEQGQRLADAAAAPAERVYWYSLIDLDPAREAIEGFHVDENEYHLGLATHEGRRKSACDTMRSLMRLRGWQRGERKEEV